MVMQAANILEHDDRAAIWRLNRSRMGAIHVQRQMCTPTMVVVEVQGEDAPKVTLVEDNDVVKAVSPDAADQAFDIRVLPRASGGGKNLFDGHAPDASTKRLAIDRIAIPEEVLRRSRYGGE
jgi:hypothetical protein